MDYVYVCRPGDNEELRYSIRSTVANLPEGRIWVVGGKPDWYTGDYIYVQQTGHGHENVRNQLRVVCETAEISDDFILMNDDFFTLKKVDPIVPWFSGSLFKVLADYSDSGQRNYGYQRLVNKTYKHLLRRSIPEPLDYELHVPMPMNKDKLAKVIDEKTLWRSTYGNTFNVGGEQHYDIKVYSNKELKGKFEDITLENTPYLSGNEANFEFLYNLVLKDMFPDPSQYEHP